MRYGWGLIFLPLYFLTADAAGLKWREAPAPGSPKAQQANPGFGMLVLESIRHDMPTGGGYSATPKDVARVAEQGVVWSDEFRGLVISPHKAAPTFCSAACYLVLLRALQRWEAQARRRFPPAVWKTLDITGNQPDGTGTWGRANANGPGLAKLVHDLGAGINFHDVRLAQPGDFLKIFWSQEIGVNERGHLVVYLGLERKNGSVHLRYWSANKPGGYGVKSAPISRMYHLIFTRITAPQNFSRAPRLPEKDEWLQNMQAHPFSFDEVRRACNIR